VNLLLVSIDTLRGDMLGCYGHDRPTSPALDTIAAQGTLFETAVSPSPWTLPAHASLLTGLYPMRHGVKSHRLRLAAGISTLAVHLRKRGFTTAAIVNSHNLTRRYGLGRGFQSHDYVRESLEEAAPSDVHARARQWLAEAREPFFLFLHFYDVHSDYRSMPPYEAMFERPYDGPVTGSTAQLLAHRAGRMDFDERGRERLIDLYVAGIRQMDDGLAELVDLLEGEGLRERTLLVITSDHGEEFLEHGAVLHGRTQYDEVLRVPLVLHGQGVPEGLRVGEPVSLIDVVPTVLSLLGQPILPGVDGRDVSPLLRGEAPGDLQERMLFGEADHNNREHDITRSVRYADFKLTYNRLTRETRLYDLSNDPAERVDVKDQHPELVSTLWEELQAFEHLSVGTAGRELPALAPEDEDRLRALGYLE
jgi:arylsulfatase A-like enzyme